MHETRGTGQYGGLTLAAIRVECASTSPYADIAISVCEGATGESQATSAGAGGLPRGDLPGARGQHSDRSAVRASGGRQERVGARRGARPAAADRLAAPEDASRAGYAESRATRRLRRTTRSRTSGSSRRSTCSATRWARSSPTASDSPRRSERAVTRNETSSDTPNRSAFSRSAFGQGGTGMRSLSSGQVNGLEKMFGSRVNLDPVERQLYSHDVGVLPRARASRSSATRCPTASSSRPTRPRSSSLVRWAAAETVPLVPRGKATSGYGGVLAVKGGVVVDFHRMNRVLAVDAEAPDRDRPARHRLEVARHRASEARPHAPTLPDELPEQHGRRLARPGRRGPRLVRRRLVPRERRVGAGGPRRRHASGRSSGADLDLISDAEGMTGLITEVTIRVQRGGARSASSRRSFESAAALARLPPGGRGGSACRSGRSASSTRRWPS